MKKLAILLLSLMLMLALVACGNNEPPVQEEEPPEANDLLEPADPTPAPSDALDEVIIRLSTTTSVNDSGLLPYLQPHFQNDTGYTLEITSAGTGAAIEKGRTGDADMLLVHSKSQEEKFIEEGFAEARIPFMYNFFVIVGPADDPAGVRDAANATEAFAAIAAGGYTFISRGDESGTHTAELKLWDAAGVEPDAATDDWYVSAGAGMGACLNMASEQQAYVLSDKATYLSHELRETLEILLEKSDEMKNTYSMLVISPEAWSDTNYEGSMAFVTWMLSDKAAELIEAYGVDEYGEQLFFYGE